MRRDKADGRPGCVALADHTNDPNEENRPMPKECHNPATASIDDDFKILHRERLDDGTVVAMVHHDSDLRFVYWHLDEDPDCDEPWIVASMSSGGNVETFGDLPNRKCVHNVDRPQILPSEEPIAWPRIQPPDELCYVDGCRKQATRWSPRRKDGRGVLVAACAVESHGGPSRPGDD